MLDVASSIRIILFLRTIVLAKHINCFWPILKFDPLSIIWSSKVKLEDHRTSFKDWFRTKSSIRPKGSRLNLRVPENKIGSWGITDRRERIVFGGRVWIFRESISISPCMFVNFSMEAIKEVFPPPVLPTIPTWKNVCQLITLSNYLDIAKAFDILYENWSWETQYWIRLYNF